MCARGKRTGEGTAEEQWFRSLFTRTTSAIIRLDINGSVIECNAAVPALTGRSESEIHEFGLPILFRKEHWGLIETGLNLAHAQDGYVVETLLTHVDGQEIAVMIGITPATVNADLVGHFVIIRNMTGQKQAMDALHDTMQQLRDARDNLEQQVQSRTQELKTANAVLKGQIAERVRAEETIRWQAYHDALTGLPNRTMFHERLNASIDAARDSEQRIGVLFIDLDRFKNVNDNLGHSVGDELLKQVSTRFQSCLTENMLLSRMGGDEFTVVVSDLRRNADAKALAKKLLATLDRPFNLFGHEVFVCGSVGVSIFPDDGEDSQSLLKNADIAMYTVKGAGGGSLQHYSDVTDSRIEDRVSLETALRRGLEREELVLYYQPQVDLNTGEVLGVEALVRWNHPELGLIAPGKFIPLAEETGLILRIDEWVMHEACRQAREWELRGSPIHIAVNVFPRHFEHSGLVCEVARIIGESGLSAGLLGLELTESALIRNSDSVRDTLNGLLAIGVRSSLDDFGTGYSSLSYLRRLPIKMLKIDQSFVNELIDPSLRHDSRSGLDLIGFRQDEGFSAEATIIRAVIEVAHALNLLTIAEGVETQFQRETLRRLGCDLMQGFLFSQPLPAAQFEELVGIRARAVLAA